MGSSIKLSKKQNEYIQKANRRWNLKIGAVRSGKSYVDVNVMIPYRLRHVHGKSGLNLILGVSRETIERDVLQPMREMYTDRLVGTINGRNIARICGEDVYCLGAEKITQVAKIQGMSVKYCYGDEIAKWNPEVFHMLQSRLDKPYSCFDGSCNPESPGHWLKEFIDNKEIDAYIQHYTIFDNPFLPSEFVDNLCKEYEGTVYYGRYINGEWTLAEGLIYPNYQQAIAEPPQNVPISDYALSIDYGTMNAFAAILWALYGRTWYAVRMYYYSGRDTGIQKTDAEYVDELDALIEGIMKERQSAGSESYLARSTSFRKMRTIIDPSAASCIAELRRRKWYAVQKADNAVLDGIRETASAMHNGHIKIAPWLEDMINELQGYVWDDNAAEDTPVKINDHACVTGETLIDTTEGKKRIKDIVDKEGYLWCYKDGLIVARRYKNVALTKRKAKIYRVELLDGRFIRCTGDHPILTTKGYKKAKDLTANDKVVCIKGVKVVHVAAVKEDGVDDVYNLEVEDTHNFAANDGIITHNCDAMRYFVKTMRLEQKNRRR